MISFSAKKFSTGCVIALFVIGGFIGGIVYESYENSLCKSKDYRFLNPDLKCGSQPVISKTSYRTFESRLEKILRDRQSAGDLKRYAVYFRDLKIGPIFGINERENFAPASLLKLPLAITYLDMNDSGEIDINERVAYEGADVIEIQTFKPKERLIVGQSYTVEELLETMIENSNNLAYLVLYDNLIQKTGDTSRMMQTYQELGLVDPKNPDSQTLDVRGYASIFRILYNASYLSPQGSSKLLGWLSKSNFKEGLRSGVPETIQLADKFGERVEDDGTKQLHDCGILYYPGNPYLLCVMTYGDDWAKLERTIRDISKIVYDEVDSRRIP